MWGEYDWWVFFGLLGSIFCNEFDGFIDVKVLLGLYFYSKYEYEFVFDCIVLIKIIWMGLVFNVFGY